MTGGGCRGGLVVSSVAAAEGPVLSVLADEDGAAAKVRVVQLLDGALGPLGVLKLHDTGALRPPALLVEDLGVAHLTHLAEVVLQVLPARAPGEVADVDTARDLDPVALVVPNAQHPVVVLTVPAPAAARRRAALVAVAAVIAPVAVVAAVVTAVVAPTVKAAALAADVAAAAAALAATVSATLAALATLAARAAAALAAQVPVLPVLAREDVPAVQLGVVHSLHRLRRRVRRLELHNTASGGAAVALHHDVSVHDGLELTGVILQVLPLRLPRQVADVHTPAHGVLLAAEGHRHGVRPALALRHFGLSSLARTVRLINKKVQKL
eukprot:Hpha_TRINITY_DN14860_c1_g3::TRINITY_DN14860_c1_g3_i1::g.169412::m.169412